MNTPITRTSILIHATLEDVWNALTKPELVQKYFFGTTLTTTWEVGTPITFSGEWEGKLYEDKGIVQSYIETKSLSYTYLPAGGGMESVVTYQIDPRDIGVEVSISQTAESEEKAKDSEHNWNLVLQGLKDMLESK